MPEVMNCAKPPSSSGIPSAAYRALLSERAVSASFWRTASTDSSAVIASTASLIASKAGSFIVPRIRRPGERRIGREAE